MRDVSPFCEHFGRSDVNIVQARNEATTEHRDALFLFVAYISYAMAVSSYAARMRRLYPFKSASTSVDHIVVGGGVIGLAVAAGLVCSGGKGRTTFVVERRGRVSMVSNMNGMISGTCSCGIGVAWARNDACTSFIQFVDHDWHSD